MQFILFLSIGLSIMYYLFHKNQIAYLDYCQLQQIPVENCSLLNKLKQDFSTLHYFWIFMIFVGFAMTNYSRTVRWQIILKTMNYNTRFANAYCAINVGYLANLGFPRIGEFVRAMIFSKYEKLPFDKVFGSVVLDRIADMLSFLLLILLAVALDFPLFQTFFTKYAHIPTFNLNYYIVGLLIVVAALLFFFRAIILELSLVKKFASLISGVWEGIRSIRNLKERNQFIIHTILIWVWFFLMFVFACKSFEPTANLPIVPMLVVYVFGSFGVFIPSPGGMGTYHFMVILGLGLYGLQQADAFSFANIAFTFGQFFALIIFGVGSLIALPWFNKSR